MNKADKPPPDYQAFLLRVWRADAQTPWRASLQSAATERMYYFATIEALFAFLDGRLAEDNAATEPSRAQEDA